MRLQNLRIGTQLHLSFALMLLFVFILSVTAFRQTNRIQEQNVLMYNHPFKVRRALGELKADILAIHRDMKDLIISSGPEEVSANLYNIEQMDNDAFRQIDVIYSQYLGPRSDVDSVKNSFVIWKAMRQETIRIFRAGKIAEAADRTQSNGVAGRQVEKVLEAVAVIDRFAENKANEMIDASEELNSYLNRHMLYLTATVVLLVLLVNFLLLRVIRKPLLELTDVTASFAGGDLNARSNYLAKNELGKLSVAFNSLADSVQSNIRMSDQITHLSQIMLSEEEPSEFFKRVLSSLAEMTGSQMYATYLLSDDLTEYRHFESAGLNDALRESFSATTAGGQFGLTLETRKIQHIRNSDDDTPWQFHTVDNTILAREIITIPILSNSTVVAIITLATINRYDNKATTLIERVYGTLNARVAGLLASKRIIEFSSKLEQTNIELQEQRESLARALNYNRCLIEASVDSLVTIDRDGRITDINNATAEFIGRSREELVGTDVAEYFTEPERARAGYKRVFREGVVKNYELAIIHSGGKVTPVLYNAAVYRDEKGAVIGILAAARDISEQKRAEAELQRLNLELSQRSEVLASANSELENQKNELSVQAKELSEQNFELEIQKKQLDEANRLKTNFLSNMSHELRTPLNSVIALSGVLNRRLANKIAEEEYGYISVIERNGKLLLSLINDILDISRIEAGKEEVDISEFNLCEKVDETIKMIVPQAESKGIKLRSTKGDCKTIIRGDAGKIRHILQNLIGNAVKFTDKGGVSVALKKHDDTVKISVADSGIGIEKEHLPHIFDEFRQADSSTSRRFGGTGLGLAIAMKYANLLGGTISVESTPGKGSTFTLILPLQYDPVKSVKIKPAEGQSRFSRIEEPTIIGEFTYGKTILLVEDSEPAVVQLKDILEEAGFSLMVARDGTMALEITSNYTPDAIILDLMMPGIDGFEVLKKLREEERTRYVPVLILTAKHITKDDLKVLKYNNIYQLIQKGDIGRTELLVAVSGMVARKTVTESVDASVYHISSKGKPLVLVVEDNPDNMLTVKALLADDFTMIEATDGEEGVNMALKHRPHLVLMDIALPKTDGIKAFQSIRSNPKTEYIPIIALTASAMTSDRETILSYGFNAYIPKPIDEDLFFRTIKATLYGN